MDNKSPLGQITASLRRGEKSLLESILTQIIKIYTSLGLNLLLAFVSALALNLILLYSAPCDQLIPLIVWTVIYHSEKRGFITPAEIVWLLSRKYKMCIGTMVCLHSRYWSKTGQRFTVPLGSCQQNRHVMMIGQSHVPTNHLKTVVIILSCNIFLFQMINCVCCRQRLRPEYNHTRYRMSFFATAYLRLLVNFLLNIFAYHEGMGDFHICGTSNNIVVQIQMNTIGFGKSILDIILYL